MKNVFCRLVTTAADHEKCLAIRRQVFIEEQKIPAEIEVDSYETLSSHFLVTSEGQPVATGRLRTKGHFVKFERIASLKSVRGMGTGRVLINGMIDHAIEHYPEYLPAMHAQNSAYGFYEKTGWVPVGAEFMEAGIPHKTMIYPPRDIIRINKLLLWNDPTASEDIKATLRP